MLPHIFKSRNNRNLPPTQLPFHLCHGSTLWRGWYMHRWVSCHFGGTNWLWFIFLLLGGLLKSRSVLSRVQQIYCYLFFLLGLLLCEFWKERENLTIRHSFETLLGRPRCFWYISHPGCADAPNKTSPWSPFSVLHPNIPPRDFPPWPLRFILLPCFCIPSPLKSSYGSCEKRM